MTNSEAMALRVVTDHVRGGAAKACSMGPRNQNGEAHPMVGALPVSVEQTPRPQGHGYVKARVDAENPFLESGLELKGHEFHYSHVRGDKEITTILNLSRGVGVGNGRDGISINNIVASYTHIHALGTPDWAVGLARSARGDCK